MIQYKFNDLPKACCARCFWWVLKPNTEVGWGQCACMQELTWFEHAPCDEYELQVIESCGTPR
jgi:hypothetical protein